MPTASDQANKSGEIGREASRRRTFAIISHPDAGKTTLTEKFLLYGGAVSEAGAVKARAGRRSATSDWMAMEQQRGISITSTVLQFEYRDHVINLLDTPGHRDFSEDTYRVLSAADAAIMVLDVAKGIEAQTLKLFQVCRARNLPIVTFLNKYDRPGRDPLELLDEIQEKLDLIPTPITWPVGIPGDFHGVIDRRDDSFVSFTRSARGSKAAGEEFMTADEAAAELGDIWTASRDEASLLDEVGQTFDAESFRAGTTSPLFVGSALTNFGVRLVLDAIVDLAPAPQPRLTASEDLRDLDKPFAAQVFKVQANMDKNHRDRVAFIRVNSGEFERGMTVTHGRTGRPFATKYAASVFGADRETIDRAFPGDVVGLVNATDLRIGDSLFLAEPVEFPEIVTFSPELFARVLAKDTSKHKQFRKGLEQLNEEGVVQLLLDPELGPTVPVIAAVGRMQFEVFEHRMAEEFGAAVQLSNLPHVVARHTDEKSAAELSQLSNVRIYERPDKSLMATFNSEHWLRRVETDNPELTLDAVGTN